MSQTSANANIQAWSRHDRAGLLDGEWSPWNTNTSTAVELYSEEPYDKIAYRIDASQAAGNTLDGVSLLLQYAVLYFAPFTLSCSVYTDDPTAGSPAPIASGTVSCSTQQAQINASVQLQTGLENAPNVLYVVISASYDAPFARGLIGYFTPDSCTVTYTIPEPTPGPGGNPPVVGTPTFSLTQPTAQLATDFPNTWISGISKCTVRAAVTADGTISRVYFTYGNSGQVTMTLENGVYVGTTPGGVMDGTLFTVTAISGGLTGSNSATLTGVEPYSPPSVQIVGLKRVYIDGDVIIEDDGGNVCEIMISPEISSLNEGNSIISITAAIDGISGEFPLDKNNSNYQKIEDEDEGEPVDLSDPNKVYVITVTILDKVGRTGESRASVNGKLRDIVMKRDTTNNVTHLGVGMTPDVNAAGAYTSIQLPAGAKIIVGGRDITAWLRAQIGDIW